MSVENKSGQTYREHRGRKFRGKRLKTALPRPMTEAPPAERKASERIAKVIARAGLCSRREAEVWIAAGRVAVNGSTITSPALNVTAQDRVTVDGKPLPQRERTRLFLFHKPRGFVTTSADPQGRPTIFDVLPKDMPRVVSVGRLDLNSEGLLLLTNDGGLARVLELPATGWLRRYRVRAHGKVTQAQLDELRRGITIEGIRYGPIEATLDRVQGANVWLTFAMREGKNREIRNVLGALGLKVNRLIRLSYGPFQLGDLPPGAVTEVRTRALREQIGERLAALAGADFSSPIAEREIAPLPPRSGGEGQRERRDDKKRGGRATMQKRPPPPTASHRSLRSRGEGRPRRQPRPRHRPNKSRRAP
jgi:23S rRNA pseudouridine2605 synthase